MDDLLARLDDALWAFLGKAVDVCLDLGALAFRKAVAGAAVAAGWLEGFAGKVAAVPLWISLPTAAAGVGLVVCYILRQRLYDRVLVYHLVWLRRKGYSKQVFRVRRGAVRETVKAMARPVPLPERITDIAVHEAVPDRYLVVYGVAAGVAEDVRTYRRDRRAGLLAMGEDLTRYVRANARLLYADGELRALFAALDARDPHFAACRPALPGEAADKAARNRVRTALEAEFGESTG